MPRSRISFVFLLASFFGAVVCCSEGVAGSATFSVPPGGGELESVDGVLSLVWESDRDPGGGEGGSVEYELQQASDESFADAIVRYRGSDAGSYLTGLAEGDYFFRVRERDGEWSPTLTASVKFIDRRVLITLLATGFVVSAATIGTILVGSLKRVEA